MEEDDYVKDIDFLTGYVSFKETEYPFVFDKDSFQLTLIPSSFELCKKQHYEWIPTSICCKTNEWVRSIVIKGHTRENFNIYFFVLENYSIQYGYYVFQVKWVAYSYDQFDLEAIDGYKVSGGEVDCFYLPKQILEYKFDYEDDHIKDFSIIAKSDDYKSCGAYFKNGTLISYEVTSVGYSSSKEGTDPLSVKSIVRTSFSESMDLEYLVNTLQCFGLLLEYITNRRNIGLHDIDLIWKTEEGLFSSGGRLLFKQPLQYEDDKRRYKRIISYNILGENSAKIIELFSNNEITNRHIRNTIGDQNHYTPAVLIMILSTFEKEYSSIFGQDYKRSETYSEIKELVLSSVDKLIESNTGKRKKYLKSIKRQLQKLDNSYSKMVLISLRECADIIKPFILQKYGEYNESILNDISQRINEMRNDIAHCKLDIDYVPNHINDIKIVEYLIYAIRLKSIGLETESIQKAINALFGLNMAI